MPIDPPIEDIIEETGINDHLLYDFTSQQK